MGISLNGLTPAGTYPGLIKTGDNTAISGTPKVLSDGNGNDLPMAVSTTGVNLTGSPTVNSVAIANTTQVAAKQDTLVSGTNIKTINGASVLGSGNIAVVTSPSGVSGAIQFSNGSAFASDASNFFWDDTNNRLGVGTNAPTEIVEIVRNAAVNNRVLISNSNTTATTARATLEVKVGASMTGTFSAIQGTGVFVGSSSNDRVLLTTGGTPHVNIQLNGNSNFGNSVNDLGARLGIKGSGSTSATTSLLVQNSAGTTSLQITDSNLLCLGGTTSSFPAIKRNGTAIDFRLADDSGFANINASIVDVKSILYVAGQVDFGGSDGRIVLPTAARGLCVSQDYSFPVSSALLEVKSTTKGFLPPRMTTTQKNAIASPAAGLIVYDSTLGKLCVRTASAWETITSL